MFFKCLVTQLVKLQSRNLILYIVIKKQCCFYSISSVFRYLILASSHHSLLAHPFSTENEPYQMTFPGSTFPFH